MVELVFDPMNLVVQAFWNLCPDKRARVMFASIGDDEDDDGGEDHPCGVTIVDGGVPTILLDPRVPYFGLVETLAHELAHVATLGENQGGDHGTEWQIAFDAIHAEYVRLTTKQAEQLGLQQATFHPRERVTLEREE